MPVMIKKLCLFASNLAMLGIVCSLLSLKAGAAQAITQEDKIKAAMVYKITQSVTWPQQIKNLAVCLIGEGSINLALKKMDGKVSQGRRISVTHKQPSAPLHQLCDILFVHHVGGHDVDAVLQRVVNKPLLTIGDTVQFTDKGGMISLVRVGKKVGININQKAVYAVKISIHSSLLNLANIVK